MSALPEQVEGRPGPSVAAEQSLLGSLLLDSSKFAEVVRLVQPASFSRRDHRVLFAAICEVLSAGKPCDAVLLAEHLERTGQLAEAGGRVYIARLAADTPSAAHVIAYASAVRERARPHSARTDLRLATLAEFATQPKIRWLVRGILPDDSLVVVFGPPKGGKTYSVCDLLMHGAHGMPWHGHRVPKALRVAFLAGEGRNGLRVRLHAWLSHHDNAALAGAFNILPSSLSLPDRVEELIELLKPFAPEVVVPDTLNAFFGPYDENSTQDMTRFVASLRQLREALGCTLVVLHHTALADTGRERGSGVLRGAADVIIQVGKDESGSGNVGFQVITGRDIEPMEAPVALKLTRVETDWLDEDGTPLTTCIVQSANQPVTLAGRGSRPLGDAQSTVLACARELAAGKDPDPSGYVLLSRSDVAAQARARAVSKQSISSAWAPLQTRGYLKLAEPGSVLLKVKS